MDDSRKKQFMIVLVVVLLAAAGVIVWLSTSGGGGETDPDTPVWMKCNNPACGHEFETTQGEYKELIETEMPPGLMTTPPMLCPKCNKASAYIAMKCEKCGKVFFSGTAKNAKYPDTCTACGYSKMGERRKQATGEPAQE